MHDIATILEHPYMFFAHEYICLQWQTHRNSENIICGETVQAFLRSLTGAVTFLEDDVYQTLHPQQTTPALLMVTAFCR